MKFDFCTIFMINNFFYSLICSINFCVYRDYYFFFFRLIIAFAIVDFFFERSDRYIMIAGVRVNNGFSVLGGWARFMANRSAMIMDDHYYRGLSCLLIYSR